MNNIRLKIGLSLLGILLFTGIISAQQGNMTASKAKNGAASLSDKQIEALKAIRQERATFRNAFRETLTGNQLDILTRQGLSRQERLRSFGVSLTATQMKMIKAHKRQMRIQNNTIQATIGEQRRMGIMRMAMNKNQQNKTYFKRVKMQNKRNGM